MTSWLRIIILSVLFIVNSKGTCPCKNKDLCLPISKQYNKEVFIFSLSKSHWPKYDWSKVTTIVEVGYHNPELLCYAHSKGVRVVSIANFQPETALTNKTARLVWVKQTVTYIAENYLDGTNVDFESPIYANQTDMKEGLTALMQELSSTLKQSQKYAQVTFDVAFRPLHHQSYDFEAITRVSDFIFDMGYDMFWNTTGARAHANCDFTGLQYGVEAFLKLGIPAKKIVLGVPWYGYDYPCEKYSQQGNICYLKNVPFRGVPCSDAAGSQASYANIQQQLLPKSTTGLLWDDVSKSPYFTYKNNSTNQYHQVWFDNPKSLSIKYNYAKISGLRGVGMWEADDLDYSDTPQAKAQRKAMWSIL